MRVRYLIPVLAVVIGYMAIATGCKKKEQDNTDVVFINRVDKNVTLDLYASEEDYANNANPVYRTQVNPQDKVTVPGSTFAGGQTYYMDWYSDDYFHHNWFNDDYPLTSNRVRINPKPGANTYFMETNYTGGSREAFLKGNGTQTSWIAVGAYLYSNNTGYSNQWPNLNTNERYRQIIIKKDFNAIYTHKTAAGGQITEEYEFIVLPSDVPYIEFKYSDGSIAGNMTGGKLPTGTPPDYKSNAKDTVMALFPDSDYIFMMVRQQ